MPAGVVVSRSNFLNRRKWLLMANVGYPLIQRGQGRPLGRDTANIYPQNFDPEPFEKVSVCVNQGGTIFFPTPDFLDLTEVI